ncbi:MAG: tRNA(fMet)-specific endonuclease VapC [Neisseria animaloris]|nr:tRNA(fMet)-specific endonuclease VapC [Neisseria animaloris]
MLDTNICIYAMKHKPESVRKAFQSHHGRMCINTVVLSELVFGAEKSAWPEKALAVVESFVAHLDIIEFDAQAAYHTAQIRAQLQKVGKPIGAYDYMIAGHARSRGLVVVTNNVREFERVDGLLVENWAENAV